MCVKLLHSVFVLQRERNLQQLHERWFLAQYLLNLSSNPSDRVPLPAPSFLCMPLLTHYDKDDSNSMFKSSWLCSFDAGICVLVCVRCTNTHWLIDSTHNHLYRFGVCNSSRAFCRAGNDLRSFCVEVQTSLQTGGVPDSPSMNASMFQNIRQGAPIRQGTKLKKNTTGASL